MPRSPVWLRKIPSTVSGSQGSRRGLRPAVRFAFPLGARLNITLRARPCQELFSESFCRPSRGPRGASRLPGLGPSRRRVRYYTLPRRGAVGKRSRTQDADNSSAVERRGTEGDSRREGAPELAFLPAPDAGPPRGPGACAPRPSGAAGLAASVRAPARPARGAARFPPSGTPPKKKDGRLRSPPALRGPPLGDRPWSILSIYRYA